jgi:hypothetical protein
MSKFDEQRLRLLTLVFIAGAIGFGALRTVASLFAHLDPDGISYLDIADAYLRRDWQMAINAMWSPLYSWILALVMLFVSPSPSWEFAIVRLLNFAIYVAALGCFHFFLIELIRYRSSRNIRLTQGQRISLPDWALLALGYALFVWTSLDWITIAYPGPDMFVAAIVYLATGMLVRIRAGATSYFPYIVLGVILGVGYLAKTFMLPMGFIFLGISTLFMGDVKAALPKALIALFVFALIAVPFIIALSRVKGYPTVGLSGKLNYAWNVNRTLRDHWQGSPPGTGTPKHPTQQVFASPAVYQFATPIGGTYPVWYDPTYWSEGLIVHFSLWRQLSALVGSAKDYFRVSPLSHGALIVAFLVLFLMGWERGFSLQAIATEATLLGPAMAAIGMYSLVHLEPRYIAAFFVLLWMGLACAVRLRESLEAKRLLAVVSIAVLSVLIPTVIAATANEVYFGLRDSLICQDSPGQVQREIADALLQIGIKPGDKIAIIGDSINANWARLSRVKIVAEIPPEEKAIFWGADPFVKSQVTSLLAKTGAKLVVTNGIPIQASADGWRKIGRTSLYAHLLPVSQ